MALIKKLSPRKIAELARQRRTKPGKVDIGRAIKLHYLQGISQSDVARTMGVTHGAIHQALKPYQGILRDSQTLAAYRNHKSDILDSIELTLCKDLLDEDKRAKATLGNVAYALDKIQGACRLEKGLRTGNEIQIVTCSQLVIRQDNNKSVTSAVNPSTDTGIIDVAATGTDDDGEIVGVDSIGD